LDGDRRAPSNGHVPHANLPGHMSLYFPRHDPPLY
jgi:hypothetical protein